MTGKVRAVFSASLKYPRGTWPLRASQPVSAAPGEANAVRRLGDATRKLDHYDDAIAHYQYALPIQRAVGDRRGEAKTLMGGCTTSQGIQLFSQAGIRRFYRGIVRNVELTDVPYNFLIRPFLDPSFQVTSLGVAVALGFAVGLAHVVRI